MHYDDAVNEDQERKADIVLFYNETNDAPGGGQWMTIELSLVSKCAE
ncbi:hypothetical protein T05_12314 [Trichinella murrelli]|uniref:Uncharacterized protein n=1 Tax=Trichinella murrelli TaxID=144512 RepID=A0A0V0SSP0_9BILA|nr:hypothetical protein T05_12314 [Trichinella murrelli]